MVDVPWKGFPDVVLGFYDIPDDCFHLLCGSEVIFISLFLVLIQEVFDILVNFARKEGCKFGSWVGHAGDTASTRCCHSECWW